MQVEGKIALVTGAASGLGRATAGALYGAGAKVVLLDRRLPEVEQAASALGPDALGLACDVCEDADLDRAFQTVAQRFGALHIAVSCAGIPSATKLLSKGRVHPIETWKTVIDVNLTGTFNVMRRSAQLMAQNAPGDNARERGVIINTASGAAYDGQRGQTAYAASKAGVVGLTLPAARDLAELAIRCVAIAPGLFDTGMVGEIPPKAATALQHQLLYPNRMGDPGEFAALVLHVIANGYLNGAVLRLDGGTRMAAG